MTLIDSIKGKYDRGKSAFDVWEESGLLEGLLLEHQKIVVEFLDLWYIEILKMRDPTTDSSFYTKDEVESFAYIGFPIVRRILQPLLEKYELVLRTDDDGKHSLFSKTYKE